MTERERKEGKEKGRTHRRMFFQDFLPVGKEVLNKSWVLDIIGFEDRGEEGSDFFCFGR